MPFYDVDRNNVESVYLLLHTLETVTVLPEKRASAADLIVNVKRAIRSFNRNSTTSAHIVKDYGIDGYIELYRFPDWLDAASKDEVESYFDSHRREYYTPAPTIAPGSGSRTGASCFADMAIGTPTTLSALMFERR